MCLVLEYVTGFFAIQLGCLTPYFIRFASSLIFRHPGRLAALFQSDPTCYRHVAVLPTLSHVFEKLLVHVS